jgi:hypothetical protein
MTAEQARQNGRAPIARGAPYRRIDGVDEQGRRESDETEELAYEGSLLLAGGSLEELDNLRLDARLNWPVLKCRRLAGLGVSTETPPALRRPALDDLVQFYDYRARFRDFVRPRGRRNRGFPTYGYLRQCPRTSGEGRRS